MADSKKVKRMIRGKMRLVTRSKWELPIEGSKSYWNEVCESIESRVMRVRSSPSTTLIPVSSIRSSASSVSSSDINDYDFTKPPRHLAAGDASAAEPIVKIYPASRRTSRDSTIKFQSNCEEESNDRTAPPLESHWRIRKLSKMTKLVNDFLSSTRTRVRPSSTKSLTSRGDDASRESSIATTTPRDRAKEKKTSRSNGSSGSSSSSTIGEREGLKKRSVVFSENIEEIDERFDASRNIGKPRRPRAPSLSIASAVPSFGRVVISIESISSLEDEEDHGKSKTVAEDGSGDTSKLDDGKSAPKSQSKVRQDFLKVPEIRKIASNSYPTRDPSIFFQQQCSTRSDERFIASKLTTESSALRKKCLWPSSRSIVHAFRALRAMKHGANMSAARIQSEANRFFAAPLEIYSPSARSSISSDDPTDFIESPSGGHNDDDGDDDEDVYDERDGSEENVDGESESSYASVRERLMRNAETHIGKDFQRAAAAATCIDEDKTLEARSQPTDSSFYNSRNSAGDKLKVKHRSKDTSAAAAAAAACFISVPRMATIFPRIKTDKCLACMCQSLAEINRSAGHRSAARFSNENNEVSFPLNQAPSDLSGYQCSRSGASYELLMFEDATEDKFSGGDRPGRPGKNSRLAATNMESTEVEIFSPRQSPESLTKSSAQLRVSPQSREVGKAMPKTVVAAKSVISSLSMASERSRSVSDQDDSDQGGCIESGGNDEQQQQQQGSGGNAAKNLASCHMPINLKPSLEPLKALKQKKSRSIRSRVASAEKSAGSATDDDDDSDDDDNNRRLLANKTGIDESTGRETEQTICPVNGSEAVDDDVVGSISSKTDDQDAETVISEQEVVKIATRCLREKKNVAETLKVLAEEYSNRMTNALSKRYNRSSNLKRNEKITKNLLTLLVDSKSYTNREKRSNEPTHLSFSSKQPPLCNSRQLRRVLPLKSYNLIAPILGMAKWYPKRRTSGILASSKVNTRHKESNEKAFDLIVHPPSRMAHRVSFEPDSNDSRTKLSPYALFLTKPRRKVVRWRPLTERDLEGYDPEATLKMRAAKITDRICEDFCQWLKSLAAGTNQDSGIDVDVLKDMFETDFTAEVCRTMQVSINEMPMVPDAVVAARNCPDAAQLALTRRHLAKDAKAEVEPRRAVGFGTALPNHLKFLPPRNGVDKKWLQCENVPTDLETMDAVWKDITHLTSVKGFIDWLKAHPRVSRPEALKKVLALKENIVRSESQENEAFKDLELDLDQIQSLKVGDNDPDAM